MVIGDKQAQAPLGHAGAEPAWRKAERTLGSAAVGQRADPAAGPKLLVVRRQPGLGRRCSLRLASSAVGTRPVPVPPRLLLKRKASSSSLFLGTGHGPGGPQGTRNRSSCYGLPPVRRGA